MGGPERCETRFNNAFPPRCFPPHALLLWDVVSLPYLGRLQKDESLLLVYFEIHCIWLFEEIMHC